MNAELEMFRKAGEALASSSPEVQKVVALAAECKSLDANIADLQAQLSSAQSRWNFIKTTEMPDAMAAMGSSEWKSPDGTIKIAVKDFVAGSLPKPDPKLEYDPEGIERRRKAIEWLQSHDGEALIKTDLTLTFGKGEHNVALDLAGQLRDKGFEPSVESGVHPQTLQAYARQRMKKGEDVDFETLGLMTSRYADIKVKPPEGANVPDGLPPALEG